MLNILISFCIHFNSWNNQMWKSNAPWKEGLNMDDPYYIPIMPIFTVVTPNSFPMPIIGDLLTIRNPKKFKPAHLLHQLNMRINPNKTLADLHRYCDKDNISHACLILGRIYEFGAYNQTEDQSLAYRYYLKVRALNDSASSAMLSFYHRYYDYNIPASIIEADYSLSYNIVETTLSSSHQYESGLTRPLSCPAASRLLLPLADVTSKMTYFQQNSELNETEIARMSNSSDPMDLYRLAMYELSVPYPSDNEIRVAKKRLKSSLAKGNPKAAAPIARLYVSRIAGKLNFTYIFQLLNKGYELNDPAAMTILAEIISMNKIESSRNIYSATDLLRKAADSGYSPAIHMLGFFTYFGFNSIPRSNTKGFELFSKAAAKGYPPAMFSAADQLIGGDGVVEDCSAAISMLRRIVDVGPWAKYLDKYVNRGSRHAFIKMLDMNLTPSSWINLSDSTNTFLKDENEINLGIAKQKVGDTQDIESGSINYLQKISNSFISEDHGLITDSRIKRIRKAREGDGSSLLWLSLMSPLSESIQWIDRMRLLPSPSCYLASVVQAIVTARASFEFLTGQMKQDDANILKKLVIPYVPRIFTFVTTVVLMILLSARVNILFSE